jgi:hypothetical protein
MPSMKKPNIGDPHHRREPMEDISAKAHLPSKKALENYAGAYMGAYSNAVEREKPEHMPPLARNAPYNIQVCLMPNQSFVMLFERADRQTITVQEKDWSFVEGAVMSGISHMVTVYAHEGPTVADAIAKGKKDAVRDIRSLEDSSVAKAVVQLEKVIDEIAGMAKGNKSVMKMAELQMEKLRPIRAAVANSGPEIDMLGMIDALRNYPTAPVEVNIEQKEKELLEKMCLELGDLSDVIRRMESQDQRLESLEQSIAKALAEFGKSLDDKVGKGLAVVLSSSDRKIDKSFSELQGRLEKVRSGEVPMDLEARLKGIEESLASLRDRPDVSKEVVLAVADVRENMGRLGQRVTRIEQYLTDLSKPKPPPKR